LSLTLLLASCGHLATTPAAQPVAQTPVRQAPTTTQGRVLGLVEVSFNRDAQGNLSVTSRPVSGLGAQALSSVPAAQLVATPLRQSSFTVGGRTSDLATTGRRYLSATFAVNNTSSGPLKNISLVAAATPTTSAGTAVKGLTRFDGSPVSNPDAVARMVMPTQSLYFDGARPRTITETADFQVFPPADLSAFGTPSGVDALLPYGFVATTPGGTSRSLPVGSSSGEVTVSVKVPLLASSTEDAFNFSMMFEVVQDSVTRVSEAPEEQSSADHALVKARVDQLGASEVNLLPGSSYNLNLGQLVCSVPLNKPGTGTDAFLVNKTVSSVVLNTDLNRKLLAKRGRVVIPSTVNFTDATSSALTLTLGATGTAVSVSGNVVTGVGQGTSDVTASACGVSSTPLNLRVLTRSTIASGQGFNVVIRPSGALFAWGGGGSVLTPPPGTYKDVAAGFSHGVGIRANTNSTVVGWGDNSYGQTTTPLDLDVTEPGGQPAIKVVAGGYHSLALKADGTLSAWGQNDSGQTDVPAGLNNVSSIATNYYDSFAVKNDGTVVGWGPYAQPGQDLEVPAGLNDVVSVSVTDLSGNAAFAVKADGSVVGWGNAAQPGGALEVPAGLTNVVQVVASGNYTAAFALKADGTVVSWGPSAQPGQESAVPAGLSDVVSLSIGEYGQQILALKSDGSLVTWGVNVTNDPATYGVPAGTTAQLP